MGRPRASFDKSLRDKRISLRVSEQERSLLLEYAAFEGLSLTGYILHKTVYADQSVVILDTEIIDQLKTELVREGNNLNQAALALNVSLRATNKDFKKERIEKALERIQRVYKELIPLYQQILHELQNAKLERRL